MIDSVEHVMWSEKYRPRTIEDCILPEAPKNMMRQYVKDGQVTNNLLLSGLSGTGKTTLARAVMAEINGDYLFINASLDRNIDMLKNQVIEFASKVSMFGSNRKYVILDEADSLNPTSTQPALKAAMEELSSNCGFIFTCNHRNKIIAPLQGRCALIEFQMPKGEEKKSLITQVFKRFRQVLQQEGVTYDDKVLMQHISRFFPDIRKTLNELQAYSNVNGSIDVGILNSVSDGSINELLKFLRDKKFTDMRKWVGEHTDVSFEEASSYLLKSADEHVEPSSIPQLILHLNKYDFQNAFVVSKEINLMTMLTEIMRDVTFK